MEVVPRSNQTEMESSLPSLRSSDIEPVTEFLRSWQNGLNRRFMVKQIPNKFRFGVGFTFLKNVEHKNQSMLFVLLR